MRCYILLVLLVLPALSTAEDSSAGVSTVDDLLSQTVGIIIDSPGLLRIRGTIPSPTIYIIYDDCCALPAASLLGDVDGNGRVDMGDVINLINFLFTEGSLPSCLECVDVTGDSRIDTGDVVALLDYLFPTFRETR